MPGWLKGLITFVLWAGVPAGVAALATQQTWLVIALLFFGVGYGLEAGILMVYDLGTPKGWGALAVDMTWSLPNTIWGFVLGNVIFWFVGTPSKADSEGQTWVVFLPRSSGGFGTNVLQTHGTLNLGGAGQHEKLHLLQARIFGPLFLPLYLACYIVTSVLQVLWSATLGWILVLLKMRTKVPLQPPARSVVSGFFGWIYYATLFELWAYNAGNP